MASERTYRLVISWVLLALMVLNTVGYYSFLIAIRDHTLHNSSERLRSNMEERGGNLILKLPLSLPYSPGSEEYQSASGSFTFEGQIYQRVMQKIYRDTLYIVCVHDQKSTDVNNKIVEYTKSFTGDETQPEAGVILIGSFSKYFVTTLHPIQSRDGGWFRTLEHKKDVDDHYLHLPFFIFHPPRLIS
jgi:hypothetical protein